MFTLANVKIINKIVRITSTHGIYDRKLTRTHGISDYRPLKLGLSVQIIGALVRLMHIIKHRLSNIQHRPRMDAYEL